MSVLFIILLIVFSLPCIIGSFIYACVTSHTKVSVLTVVLLLLFGAVISVIIYLIRVENNANKATDSNEVKKDGNKVETIDVDAEIQEVQKLLDKDMINEEESGLMVQEIMKRKELEAKEKEEFNAIQAKEKEKEIQAKEKEKEAKEKEIQAKEKEELLKEFEILDKLLEEKVITQKEYDNTKVNLLQQFVKAK